MELNARQYKILDIVKNNQPITGEEIAQKLNLTRATLRPDLSILTMSGLLEARPRVGYFYVDKGFTNITGDYLKKLKVGEVKSLPIVITEGQSIYEAIVTLFLEDVGTIYVVKDGFLSGVVSRKDLLKTTMGKANLETTPVDVVMTRLSHIIFVEEDSSVYEAIKKIINYQVDSLPVVKKVIVDGKEYLEVVGRFTKTNIAKLFLELAEGK
ncbi:CBS domain-containing protein [Anaerobranca californiensis DSM 14826]|jgi:CBS domain-containing protein/biotin operon repressor|uniref:CBS domain-containing protein n=1 Tax=Anaerobranca californiensis DSM 14826 TaxID=1120989 RepID=A0A1M6L0Q4_9FIRM|nr:helix-turn-helix transcriptional regulator [Anaerobranca californiensis]SHJ64696.1 CBS domain-containing protein [Anaerobranca californiensis DSM 14826]